MQRTADSREFRLVASYNLDKEHERLGGHEAAANSFGAEEARAGGERIMALTKTMNGFCKWTTSQATKPKPHTRLSPTRHQEASCCMTQGPLQLSNRLRTYLIF